MNYEEYLGQLGYAPGSVYRYSQSIKEFSTWLESWKIEASALQYADLLHYLEALKKRDLSSKSLQHHLTSLRHYYTHLIKEGKAAHNPVLGLNVKQQKLLPHSLLEQKELDELFTAYQGELQNRVILGLIIYQATRTAELQTLRLEHVQLRKALLHIPATGKNKSRTLALEAVQILDLQQLLEKREGEENLLEGLRKGSRNLSQRLHKLYKELRELNQRVKNGDQLRQSRIAHWLKTEDLRQVQQKAGHRFVSSTERYLQTNTEELLEQLKLYHPRK
ncbi:tyrosine-type recombinase/integrase [Cesiribacter sp. SM1]|uniref:tyrosine-type recombinase/integrase n=1 Tax=Cesiribacter sp. SM1 TaxID=2861196 RepID=UPI001CD754B3|nr:tyrosine-type recombinase/integrase [Cesiribacter sp. SM1]